MDFKKVSIIKYKLENYILDLILEQIGISIPTKNKIIYLLLLEAIPTKIIKLFILNKYVIISLMII